MTFAELMTAAEKGAASVYHAVVATGAAVTTWESDPVVAPLLSVGVTAANAMLARAGVPMQTSAVVESDISIALKALAAVDPTVQSGGAVGALVNVGGFGTPLATTTPAAEGAASIHVPPAS